MFTRAYMHAYGVTAEDLGRVAIIQRDHAALNPKAMMRQPMAMADYLGSRWIAEPLRLFDCCLESDAAVALVVTSAQRGRDLRRTPVSITAIASGGGSQLASNRHHDLTATGAARMAPHLYRAADLEPADVDVVEFYDAFTTLVPLQLEAYGFCAPGEASSVIAEGATRIGGRLPVNTHGGHLSEGYVHGLNHVIEAVRQLRHECGPRQVADARVALSTAQPGVSSGLTGAVILKRGA
jgi:acetyl-CoA acetyltransferase